MQRRGENGEASLPRTGVHRRHRSPRGTHVGTPAGRCLANERPFAWLTGQLAEVDLRPRPFILMAEEFGRWSSRDPGRLIQCAFDMRQKPGSSFTEFRALLGYDPKPLGSLNSKPVK